MDTISAPARVRARNQITIPDRVAQAAGIEEGDTFVVELAPEDRDVVRLRRVRETYAGALTGLYAPVEEYLEELRNER